MPRRTRAHRRRGFTLTEAIVLITVLGILAAVAAPRFLDLASFAEARFHDALLADLRQAQEIAIATGCDVAVDFSGSGYVLEQRTSCDSGAFDVDVVRPSDGSTPFAETAPSGLAFSSDVDPLVFDPLGRATTSTGAVTSATIDVGGRYVTVEGETGFVHEG